jgi:hypothetical protein
MPKYFFHLKGDVPARDLLGHECAGDKDALDYAKTLAREVGADEPHLVREANYVLVVRGDGSEAAKVHLRSAGA